MKPHDHWRQMDNVCGTLSDDEVETKEKFVLDAKHERTMPEKVVETSDHLSSCKKEKLWDLSRKHHKLFDRNLGHYPHEQVHLESEEGVTPVHS